MNPRTGKHRFTVTGCSVTANGSGTTIRNYDFAIGTFFSWRRSNRNTAIPSNAVIVGFDSANRPSYSCRGNVGSALVPGRVS